MIAMMVVSFIIVGSGSFVFGCCWEYNRHSSKTADFVARIQESRNEWRRRALNAERRLPAKAVGELLRDETPAVRR